MKRKTIGLTNLFFIGMLILSLPGCMMLGMGGMHGMNGMHDGSTMQKEDYQQKIIKEVISDDIKVTAEFPPYNWKDEIIYQVTVMNNREDKPISSASLIMHIEPVDDMNEHGNHTNSDILELIPDEIVKEKGLYIFKPKLSFGGKFKIRIEVMSEEEKNGWSTTLEQEVNISSAKENQHDHSGSSQSSFLTPTVIAGTAVMGVMMLLMMRAF